MNGAIHVGTTSQLKLYQPPMICLQEKLNERIAVRAIGAENPNFPAPGKVLMAVGATGSGKTTFINALTNYIYGVDWNDDFRYKLITDEGVPSQTNSQTSWITAYIFYKTNTYSTLPYTLTVIDTPGFGDTSDIQRDKEISHQIKELFTSCGFVDQLHAIAFVAMAPSVRLTHSQKYIFDATFGRDIESNIMLLATFADGQVPPVFQAAKEANVPYCEALKFNNCALYKCNDDNDTFGHMFWEMGTKSFGSLFNKLVQMEPRSLYFTRVVLKEREHLEATLAGIQAHIDEALVRIENIKKERKILEGHEDDINSNKDYSWEKHENTPSRYDTETVQVQKTYDSKKATYEEAVKGKTAMVRVIYEKEQELKKLNKMVLDMVREAHTTSEELKKITLKSNSLSEVEYIDSLIASENQEKKEGYLDRVSSLQEIRKQAQLMSEVNNNALSITTEIEVSTDINGSTKKPGWRQLWGLYIKK